MPTYGFSFDNIQHSVFMNIFRLACILKIFHFKAFAFMEIVLIGIQVICLNNYLTAIIQPQYGRGT